MDNFFKGLGELFIIGLILFAIGMAMAGAGLESPPI